jgi:hypothetical protein
VTVGLALPWLAYQRFYDPPGNRLVKWHLAGVVAVDDRSFVRALADSYARAGLGGTLGNKVANCKALVAENDRELFGIHPAWSDGGEPAFSSWRRREFHQLAAALGVLNVGWIVLLAALLRRRKLPRAEKLTAAFTLAGLAVWVLLMFGPGTTVVHQGPYATFLLLFALLAVWIFSLPIPWAVLAAALHVGWFLVVWVVTSPANGYALPNVVMIVWFALLATGLGALAWWLGRRTGAEQAEPIRP